MSAPEVGLAAALCTDSDIMRQSKPHLYPLRRIPQELQVKVEGVSLLEIRHQSLLSTFIFDDCPLISLALNVIQYKHLKSLLKNTSYAHS
jgi:hypothetical protein